MPLLLLWGELEPAIGVLVACAPILRNLIWRDRSKKGSSYDRETHFNSSGPQKVPKNHYFGLDDSEYPLRTVDVKGGPTYSCASVEEGEINRTDDITVAVSQGSMVPSK